VPEEPRADRFGAQVGGDPHDFGGEVVGTGDRNEQRVFVLRADVDRRAHLDVGRSERTPSERRRHVVRVGVAEETKRDMPVLRADEARTHLILPMEFAEEIDDVIGRPEADEQSAHRSSLATSADGTAHRFVQTVAVEVTIGKRPDAVAALGRLTAVLEAMPDRVVACSGGVDSLVLATVAHQASAATRVAHTATPAVPGDATARVVDHAQRNGWQLEVVRSGEFDDERYLANPTERCYFCKSNLYDAISALLDDTPGSSGFILSGANTDDLGEYRPGLDAAAERGVRHPFVDAGIGKPEIRAIARHLGMAEADLPASPCLASRLYTGTRVTASKLRAVEAGEALVRDRCGIGVVRCRVRDADESAEIAVMIEVSDVDRPLVTQVILADVAAVMSSVEPSITSVELDADAYAPGRSFVGAPASSAGKEGDGEASEG